MRLMYSDEVLSSIVASRMKKKNPHQQMVVIYKPVSLRIRQPDTWESAFKKVSAL